MNRTYQIEKQRALQRFQRQAETEKQPVQIVLPLAEIVAFARQGIMKVLREVGVELIQQVMNSEANALTKTSPGGNCIRWGQQRGYCILGGQKVGLEKPCVRSLEHGEIQLGSYHLFQKSSLLEETVWQRIMRGLSMRSYEEVMREFKDAYGIEKSTISGHFVVASRQRLQRLRERPLQSLQLCAVLIDGQWFSDQEIVVALGIRCSGHKVILGLRQGASENATLIKQLLADLQSRGLDFQIPRLYILDGSKALQTAVKHYVGPAAIIQRCQQHKRENVVGHLTEEYKSYYRQKLLAAYSMSEYVDAKRGLQQLHRELMDLNPSAAHSLEEGLEDTLTIHRLRLPARLRQSLATTNAIESSFSIVEKICRNVKRWRGGDQFLRWVSSGLLFGETRWNRITGHRQIPLLLKELELAVVKRQVPSRHAGVA